MAPDDASQLFGAEHVRRYRETGGEIGHDWRGGTSTLLLTTTGRRSGRPHETPLIYGRDGEQFLVVASKGGAEKPPAWYLNLEADPKVELQVRAERFGARARTASPEERARLWPVMTAEWSAYDDYQAKTAREIPIVVLERAQG